MFPELYFHCVSLCGNSTHVSSAEQLDRQVPPIRHLLLSEVLIDITTHALHYYLSNVYITQGLYGDLPQQEGPVEGRG